MSENESSSKKRSKLDLNPFKSNFSSIKKHSKWLIPLFCILIAMSMSIYLRTMPLHMPITDQWAEDTVMNFYQNQVSNQINSQYVNLPEANKQALAQKELDKVLSDNADRVASDIEGLSNQYKEQFRDDDGNLYILGIDPYYYLRQSSNLLENGHPGTEIIGGESKDMFRLPPKGVSSPLNFHLWMIAFVHKLLNLFLEIPLVLSFFLIGTIFSALSVIPSFFIGRRITKNNVGGFFTAMLIAVSQFFVARTTGESSDTDVYTVFFPLLITWLFLESFESSKLKRGLFYSVLAGISVGLFSSAWSGWWYVFDFTLASMGTYLLYRLFQNRNKVVEYIKSSECLNNLKVGLTYFVTSLSLVFVLIGKDSLFSFITGPFSFLSLKDVGVRSIWPNIQTTVAELNVQALSNVINTLGGRLVFFLALVGIFFTIFIKDKHGRNDIKIFVILTIWFAASLYATTKGVRFILQATPVFAISFGAFLGISWAYASKWLHKNINLSKNISKITMFILLALFLIQPIQAGYDQAYGSVPSMNDGWYDTLSKINNEAPQEAVITSWWDFGYWFMAVGNRPATFDGAAQVGYDAYWVGKSLITADEKLTVGLVKMVNCGQDSGFNELNKVIKNHAKSIDVLEEIIVEDKDSAIAILSDNGLSSLEIASVIKYTHCDAPVDYYITSEDMVGKAGVWGHFGSWDFNKAMMYQAISGLERSEAVSFLVNDFGLSEEDADQYYYEIKTTDADKWISPWPGYHSGLNSCSKTDNNLVCEISSRQGTMKFNVDLSSMNVTIDTGSSENIVSPDSVVYATNEGVKEKNFDNSGQKTGVSLILVPNGDGFKAMLSDPLHADSVFTKLFFFNGHGLECFEKFDDVTQFTGGRIITWIIDYQCNNENQVYFVSEDEVKGSHILIGLDNRTEEEALKIAEDILEDLSPDNFAEKAEEYSEGPSASRGGDLGWFGKGMMVPAFEEVAFSLKVGEISKPVLTQFGYHLIFVEDIRVE